MDAHHRLYVWWQTVRDMECGPFSQLGAHSIHKIRVAHPFGLLPVFRVRLVTTTRRRIAGDAGSRLLHGTLHRSPSGGSLSFELTLELGTACALSCTGAHVECGVAAGRA